MKQSSFRIIVFIGWLVFLNAKIITAQNITAAVNWTPNISNTGNCYLFMGTKYVSYPLGGNLPNGPDQNVQSKWNLPGSWDGQVDAAVNWGNGIAYLFHDTEYVKYALGDNKPTGSPKSTQDGWHLPPHWGGRVDAAVNWVEGKVYLFYGSEYMLYRIGEGPSPNAKNTSEGWNLPSSWGGHVDAAFNWGNGKAYLFHGNEYVAYRIGDSRPLTESRNTERYWMSSSVARDYFSFTCTHSVSNRINGCSNPGSDPVAETYRELFKPACNRHDVCYGSPWRQAGINDESGRDNCDNAFLVEMREICNTTDFSLGEIARAECLLAAEAFYIGVEKYGMSAYINGQDFGARKCRVIGIPKPPEGVVVVRNDAGFVAWFSVSYTVNGKTITKESGRFPFSEHRNIIIPFDATNIKIRIEGDLVGIILEKSLPDNPNKCFEIDKGGTILGATASECGKI